MFHTNNSYLPVAKGPKNGPNMDFIWFLIGSYRLTFHDKTLNCKSTSSLYHIDDQSSQHVVALVREREREKIKIIDVSFLGGEIKPRSTSFE